MSASQSVAESTYIHVALVEDDICFQSAFALMAKSTADIKMVGTAFCRAEGLDMLQGAPADVLLVDLGLPDGSGIDVIQAAQHLWPNCAVMVNTTFGDEANVIQSIEAGAAGYLLKDSSTEYILSEIRNLNAGGSPVSPMIARQVLMLFRQRLRAPRTRDDAGALSAREKEVLSLTTKGFTASEIAQLMQISHHTVQTYVRRIYSKLKVTSKTEAIYEARKQRLLDD